MDVCVVKWIPQSDHLNPKWNTLQNRHGAKRMMSVTYWVLTGYCNHSGSQRGFRRIRNRNVVAQKPPSRTLRTRIMELALVGNPEEGGTLPVHEILQEHRLRKIGVPGPKSKRALACGAAGKSVERITLNGFMYKQGDNFVFGIFSWSPSASASHH